MVQEIAAFPHFALHAEGQLETGTTGAPVDEDQLNIVARTIIRGEYKSVLEETLALVIAVLSGLLLAIVIAGK